MNQALKAVLIFGVAVTSLSIFYYLVVFLPHQGVTQKPEVSEIKTSTPVNQAKVSCRADMFTPTPLPTISADYSNPGVMRSYFKNVIDSNASLVELQALQIVLAKYRDSVSNSSPTFNDQNSGIPFTPDQLNSMDAANGEVSDAAIRYYNAWITVTGKIIQDKKDNNCIDPEDFDKYILIPGLQ